MGVIGLGLIAQVAHLPALKARRDDVEVTHLCDISSSLAATIRSNGWPDAKVTTDWTELLSADLDAVIICTPGSHGRIANAFLSAGKHVLAEKPLCVSAAACEDLRDVARANDVVLQVGYMKVHEPMVKAAADARSTIGALRHVRITVMHPADEPQTSHLTLDTGVADDLEEIARSVAYEDAEVVTAIGQPPTALRKLYTDVLQGSVVHQFALLRGLVGSVPETWDSVLTSPLTLGSLDEPPSIQAQGQLADGTAVSLSWNWVPGYPKYREEAEVIGSNGSLHLTLSPPYAYEPPRLTVITNCEAGECSTEMTAGHIDAFERQMQDFIRAIATGGPAMATADDALADVRSMQSLLSNVAAGLGVQLEGEAAQ